ncbi:MAG: glutathione S-transferase [Thiotrichaceae bacterium]|nr:glutathione S-transferase [Thiotrichaceae bacterium]PCI14087.1 MAG: glutathione S-transferase [Thiotrichales bacterium]
MDHPILYSFRRCPYAIRARLALRASGVQVVLREVVLADKPAALRQLSAKATVPVLVDAENNVIDESLDIMRWALRQSDPDGWLMSDNERVAESQCLISTNDTEFKPCLDRYKYADRFPEQSVEFYRAQAEVFLTVLEAKLTASPYLLSECPTLADMAIFPFIRQFANVDKAWFEKSPYRHLQAWLTVLLALPLFTGVMDKYAQWQPDDPVVMFQILH